MSNYKMVEYDGVRRNVVYKTTWSDDYNWYWLGGSLLIEDIENDVLYRELCGDYFVTRHNGKIICLYPTTHKSYIANQQQLHDLIERGLTPYDAFKVMCL